jgi:hypothetical protein
MTGTPDGWDTVDTASDSDVASGRGANLPEPATPHTPKRRA